MKSQVGTTVSEQFWVACRANAALATVSVPINQTTNQRPIPPLIYL